MLCNRCISVYTYWGSVYDNVLPITFMEYIIFILLFYSLLIPCSDECMLLAITSYIYFWLIQEGVNCNRRKKTFPIPIGKCLKNVPLFYFASCVNLASTFLYFQFQLHRYFHWLCVWEIMKKDKNEKQIKVLMIFLYNII